MTQATAPIRHADRFYIGGGWVEPSTDSKIERDRLGHRAALLQRGRGPGRRHLTRGRAAREAFEAGRGQDDHAERAEYLRAIGAELEKAGGRPRPDVAARVRGAAAIAGGGGTAPAARSTTTPVWPARTRSRSGPSRPPRQFGLLVREPVGVVGAIIPWNAPMGLISNKVAPALLAGCTVILKTSPEAPGEGI